MTWGGLRGGISIALALGLSQDMHRDMFFGDHVYRRGIFYSCSRTHY